MGTYFKKKTQGQSLIEVVVATGALSLLLISLLALVALSVKNSRLAKDRAQAVALAQEGVELMRTFRDYSWSGLVQSVQIDSYALPKTWVVETGLSEPCPINFPINNFFRRCVTLRLITTDTIEVAVIAAWQEGSQVYQTVQTTNLSLWER